ncbi:MAG: response regulator transcription factor [Planctomycetaceae bacterium]|nr:response regulator transcription factor [Planctomycetaceae bacterium]
MRILVVEDESAIAKGLKFNFEQEGYQVDIAGDGRSALELHAQASPPFDLIVLDLMLPEMSGYETCRELRRTDLEVPVLALTARTLAEDKAQAFDCGVDQYITKPFALPELLSRVRNLLDRRRRSLEKGAASRPVEDVERFGNIVVDFGRFELRNGDEVHSLTTREQELLRYFLRYDDVVLSRSRLQSDVWRDSAEITSRSIDNFVMRLRKMIEADSTNPRHLISIRGTGYRFIREPENGELDAESGPAEDASKEPLS